MTGGAGVVRVASWLLSGTSFASECEWKTSDPTPHQVPALSSGKEGGYHVLPCLTQGALAGEGQSTGLGSP